VSKLPPKLGHQGVGLGTGVAVVVGSVDELIELDVGPGDPGVAGSGALGDSRVGVLKANLLQKRGVGGHEPIGELESQTSLEPSTPSPVLHESPTISSWRVDRGTASGSGWTSPSTTTVK